MVDEKTWELISPVGVKDKDKLLVTAKLSPGARIDMTLDFLIEEEAMKFSGNETFKSEEIESTPQTIVSAPAGANGNANGKVMAFPQPAKDRVTLRYTLPSSADVRIQIFDREGVLIHDINEPGKLGGSNDSTWDVREVPAGVYFARFEITSVSGGKDAFTKRIYIDK